MKIFGIVIDNLTKKEIQKQIESFLDEPKAHQIATLNPEFLLEARSHSLFHSVLEKCDMRLVDGFGITFVSFFLGTIIKCRFAGADWMEYILAIAHQKKMRVFLLVRKDGLSSFKEIKEVIQKKYPGIDIGGEEREIMTGEVNSLLISKYDIVFCNFGMPYQETYLDMLKKKNTQLRLLMGVGGSFDYLTGKQKRAPRLLQWFGIEWFWRLALQPKRWKRILNAVFFFPFYVFLDTIQGKK